MQLERPEQSPPSLSRMRDDIGGVYAVNGLIGFIFAATGPVAIILSVGTAGGLSQTDLASWIFGAFFVNGLLAIAFSWFYSQPLVFFWTIPGTVLVGPALGHLSFAEVIGAFVATGLLMLILGLSGWVRRVMDAVPMPIVMGMVAGVFLKFGLDLVQAVHADVRIAGPMVLSFLALSALPRLARAAPPLLVALVVGVVAIVLTDSFQPAGAGDALLVRPGWYTPQFSLQAMVELVVPLAITVLVVQNGQGVAVLNAVGHRPPINAITTACGATSLLTAMFGTVSTCLTGPTNAIVASAGQRSRHYTGAIVVGVLALGFGLFSPMFTRWMLATPPAFIATLAGLAMLRVLQTAFTISFRDRFTLGALVTFLVTVSGVSIASIGAPFWGLVFGFACSWLLERDDFHAARSS